jgi:hypothetical protein
VIEGNEGCSISAHGQDRERADPNTRAADCAGRIDAGQTIELFDAADIGAAPSPRDFTR